MFKEVLIGVVKSSGCFSRGPRFESQPLHRLTTICNSRASSRTGIKNYRETCLKNPERTKEKRKSAAMRSSVNYASALAGTTSTPRQCRGGSGTARVSILELGPGTTSSSLWGALRPTTLTYLSGTHPRDVTSPLHLQERAHFVPQNPKRPIVCCPQTLVTLANQALSLWQQLRTPGRKGREQDSGHRPSWSSLPPAGSRTSGSPFCFS